MNVLDEKIEIKKKEVNFFTAVLVDNVCRTLRNGFPTAIVEIKQLLLKGEITPRTINEHGCSILHATCQGGLLEVVIDIFQKGYGFESDKEGNAPLHIAHLFCHKDLIDWFISRGQSPHIKNRDG
jgi:ankyrin repeat protein